VEAAEYLAALLGQLVHPALTGAPEPGPRGAEVPALLVSGRGEASAQHLHRCHWGLAGRVVQNPSAACPFGSHWSGLTQGSRCLPLANGRLRGVWSVFSAPFPAMAIPQGPVCEVRLLVVHRYPPGVQKLGTTPCEVEFFGRRGKPVKKMRLIPAEKAFAFARKLQGTPGCTVSVC